MIGLGLRDQPVVAEDSKLGLQKRRDFEMSDRLFRALMNLMRIWSQQRFSHTMNQVRRGWASLTLTAVILAMAVSVPARAQDPRVEDAVKKIDAVVARLCSDEARKPGGAGRAHLNVPRPPAEQ